MYVLYNFLFTLWLIFAGPVVLRNHRRRGRPLVDLNQRLGDTTHLPEKSGRPTVWFHACSVGEALSIQKVVAEFHEAEPTARLVFSTVTSSGQTVAKERFSAYGENCVFYLPVDTVMAVRKTLDRMTPSMLVIVDTEIWPNLIREAKRRNIPVVLVNGRISPRSFKRYRWAQPFLGRVFPNYRALLAGSKVDADRLQMLGASPAKIRMPGNLKYDLAASAPDQNKIARLDLELKLTQIGAPLIVAGSTHEGEDEVILRAFLNVRLNSAFANTVLLLAPRHPERAKEVYEIARRIGFNVRLRSESNGANTIARPRGTDVIVLDTIGELASAYSFATVAFVGGSLVAIGGHSILEPAAFGKPVVVGPHMENSPGVIDEFLERDAVLQLTALEGSPRHQQEELSQAILSLLQDPLAAGKMGRAARTILNQNRGATSRTVAYLQEFYLESVAATPQPESIQDS